MPTPQKKITAKRRVSQNTLDSRIEREEETPQKTGEVHPTELRRAVLSPIGASPAAILGLQARYGNRAVQRLLESSPRGAVQRGLMSDLRQNLKVAFAKKKKRDVLKDMTKEDVIKAMFADPAGRRLLSDYTRAEMSQENFNAYSLILKYEDAGRPIEMAQEFQNRFIDRKSEEEINIPAKGIKDFNEAMTRNDPGNILTGFVKEQIMGNLLDTFSRFELTLPYKQWMNSAYTGGAAI